MNKDNIFKNKEVYLIRNSVKQVGFFDEGNFYPDFIMWIIDENKQYITFIDPKGLRNTSIYDEKVKLHKTIKEYEQILNNGNNGQEVLLNSFILSVTSIDNLLDMYKGIDINYFEDNNILFIDVNEDNTETIDKLINKILSKK